MAKKEVSRVWSASISNHKAPTPSPVPLRVAKTGKNHLNEVIIPPPPPLLPTGIARDLAKPYQI